MLATKTPIARLRELANYNARALAHLRVTIGVVDFALRELEVECAAVRRENAHLRQQISGYRSRGRGGGRGPCIKGCGRIAGRNKGFICKPCRDGS